MILCLGNDDIKMDEMLFEPQSHFASHSGSAFGDEHKEEQFFHTCEYRHVCTSYFQYFLLTPGLQDCGKQTELCHPFKKRLSKKTKAQ